MRGTCCCEIWGSHSTTAKNSQILECHAVLSGGLFWYFAQLCHLQSKKTACPWRWKWQSCAVLWTTHPVIQCRISEHLNMLICFCSAFLTAAVRLSPRRSLPVGKCPASWLWVSLSAATLHPLLKPQICVCWVQLSPYCTSLSLTETSAVNQIPHTGPATLRCKLHLVNNNNYNQTQLQCRFMWHPTLMTANYHV